MFRVVIVQELLAKYRVEFYEGLRTSLEQDGVALDLIHGKARGMRAQRRDEAELSWAKVVRNRTLAVGSGRHVVWQPVLRDLRGADLVIVEQANKHVLNLLLAFCLHPTLRYAFWGHGLDRLTGKDRQVSAWTKRLLAVRPDWWFAYTEGAASYITGLGYPQERVTVVQNAVGFPETPMVARKGLRAVFIGALTQEKRLGYLISACRRIAAEVPGFELVIAGDGPCRSEVERLGRGAPWLRLLPAVFDEEKAILLRSSQLVLMPGLVGLIAVDSFAGGAPVVTVDARTHSPEFEYLSAANAVILDGNASDAEYADRVIDLLRNPQDVALLREECLSSARTVNIGTMIENFRRGILEALSARTRTPVRRGLGRVVKQVVR